MKYILSNACVDVLDASLHLFIRGSVRPSVGPLVDPSVGQAFVKNRENQPMKLKSTYKKASAYFQMHTYICICICIYIIARSMQGQEQPSGESGENGEYKKTFLKVM